MKITSSIISSTRLAVSVLTFSSRFDLMCGMIESSSFCVVAFCQRVDVQFKV